MIHIRAIGDLVDGHGHGSHVAGSLGGSALESSSNAIKANNGVAPSAKFYITDLSVGSKGVLENVKWPAYFQEPYDAGAR